MSGEDIYRWQGKQKTVKIFVLDWREDANVVAKDGQNIQEKASQKKGVRNRDRQFDSGQGEGRNIYPHAAVTRNETQVCKTNRGRADNHQGGRGIRAES